MARILEYEIKGLAGRKRIVRGKMSPHLNVLWGSNGSGKTSLLKILHSALSNDAQLLSRVSFSSASVVIQSDVADQPYVRTIEKTAQDDDILESIKELADIDNSADYRFFQAIRTEAFNRITERGVAGWKTSPDIPDRNRGVFGHVYLPISRISEGRGMRGGGRRSTAEALDEAAFDKLFASQIQDLWQEYSARASFDIRKAQEQGLGRILNHVLIHALSPSDESDIPATPGGDADAAFALVETFLKEQRVGRNVNISRSQFLANYDSAPLVHKVVAEVADVQKTKNKILEPQQNIEKLLRDLYFRGKKVEFQGRRVVVTANGQNIALEDLSSGEKQIMQLLLECLTAGDRPVIIDEPEISLHVDVQRNLVDYMRIVNPRAQLIMATHSPEIVAFLGGKNTIEMS